MKIVDNLYMLPKTHSCLMDSYLDDHVNDKKTLTAILINYDYELLSETIPQIAIMRLCSIFQIH